MALVATTKTVVPPPAWNIAQVFNGARRGQYWPISTKTGKGGKALRSLSGARKIWGEEFKNASPTAAAEFAGGNGINPFTFYVPDIRTAGTADQLYQNLGTIFLGESHRPTDANGQQGQSIVDQVLASPAVTSGQAAQLAMAVTRYRDPNFYNTDQGKFYAYLIWSGFTPLSIRAPLSTIGRSLYNEQYKAMDDFYVQQVGSDKLLKKRYEAEQDQKKVAAGHVKAPKTKAKKDINMAAVWNEIGVIALKGVSHGQPTVMVNGQAAAAEKKVTGGGRGGGGTLFSTKLSNMVNNAANPNALIDIKNISVNAKGQIIGGRIATKGITRSVGNYNTLNIPRGPGLSRVIIAAGTPQNETLEKFRLVLKSQNLPDDQVAQLLSQPGTIVNLATVRGSLGNSSLMNAPSQFQHQHQFQQSMVPASLGQLPVANPMSPRLGGLGGLPMVTQLNTPGGLGTPGSQGLGGMFNSPLGGL